MWAMTSSKTLEDNNVKKAFEKVIQMAYAFKYYPESAAVSLLQTHEEVKKVEAEPV